MASTSALKIGLIGLDTSHVPAFTKLLNDEASEHHVPGARVTCGYPGGADDFDKSYERVEKYTAQIRDDYGVEILDSPAAVAERSDLVIITAVDGRQHLDFFKQVAGAGKPVFIDKPLATRFDHARQIFALASERGIAVMSCSSLRYAEPFTQALAAHADEPIHAIDLFGPMAIEPTQGGLFWYGCHTVEMAVTAMGGGAATAQVIANDHHDAVTFTWEDGRVATIHGLRGVHHQFGGAIQRATGPDYIDMRQPGRPPYAPMLEAILRTLPHGQSDVPAEQSLAIVAMIEAANASRGSGKPYDVPAVPAMS
ncbi:MAG: Gfo/Idh/MocA family oxidoreductase [Phycisphaeraceae bacterium]